MSGPSNFTAVIADDDGDIASLMRIAVAKAGGDVVATAHDGSTALREIQTHRPRVALLDVSMPGLTGVEVCRALTLGSATATEFDGPGRAVGTAIVLVSAQVQPETVALGLAAGADRYVEKPFSVKALARTIQELLEGEASS